MVRRISTTIACGGGGGPVILLGEGAPARRRVGALLAGTAVVAAGLTMLPSWPAARMSIGLTRLIRAYRFGGDPLKGWQTVTEMSASWVSGV